MLSRNKVRSLNLRTDARFCQGESSNQAPAPEGTSPRSSHCSSPCSSYDEESPPPPRARPARLQRPFHRVGARRRLGRFAAAQPRRSLLVRLHVHVHARAGGGKRSL